MEEKDRELLKEIWAEAQHRAQIEYEEELGNWDEADKYEREDFVFTAYLKIKEERGK